MYRSSPFFNRLYADTLVLLLEARNHAIQLHVNGLKILPRTQSKIVCESLRVTSLLTQTMAWLLFQKGIHAGEIPNSCILDKYNAILQGAIFDDLTGLSCNDIPNGLKSILLQSHSPYQIVKRLDSHLRHHYTNQIAYEMDRTHKPR